MSMRNPVIVARRVYLRPLELDDAEIVARWTAEEAETFWDSGRLPWSPLAEAADIRRRYESEPPREIVFAACLRADGALIGTVGIYGIDWVHRYGETGSYFGRTEHRGRSLGTESKLLLLEYAFDRIGLHVLQSQVFEPNERSWRALTRQGYRPAGRLRATQPKDGVLRDTLYFDILREEWLAARQNWVERAV